MGTRCPKCDYVRQPNDETPDWQCPSCGVAYNKVSAERSDTPRHSQYNDIQPEESSPRYEPASDDIRDSQNMFGWFLYLFGFREDREWSWKWFFLFLLVVGVITLSQRCSHHGTGNTGTDADRTRDSSTPHTIPRVYEIGSNAYIADHQRLQQFEDAWESATNRALKATRTLSRDYDSAEYRTAMRRLSNLQHEWNAIAFRTNCYRGTRTIFADALLSSKDHIETNASAETMSTDQTSPRMFRRYYSELNSCLPNGQTVYQRYRP